MLVPFKNPIKTIKYQSLLTFFISNLICLFCLFSPVFAQEAQEAAITPDAAESIVKDRLIAEIDPNIIVKLDGDTLESTQVHRDQDGALYVNAMPIFSALDNEFEYDEAKKALIVRRSQDGVVMELYTDTGIVKANGKALGKLQVYGEVSQDQYLLTPNAIAVLSGTNLKFDQERQEFLFELDPRLKVATGFEIFVNDIALGHLEPAPKSVGPVLILPLLPIAEALGHDVSVIEGGDVVRVRRAQDSAVLSLNMTTGLVKLRESPYGITKDISYIDPTNLLLPVNAIETLTGTHVSVEGGSNRIDINLDDYLDGAVKPETSVDEQTKNTPFTPERLSFHLGPDTVNTITGDFRVSKFNGQLRYEIPDLPSNIKEAEPSWLSLDFAHVDGARGTIGDYAADFRELEGVGLRRIRGVSGVKELKTGRLAVAAGVPASGAKFVSGDQSRLTFSGAAAGARYASVDGWEAGAAYKKDGLTNDQMAVLSAISGRLGRIKDKKLQWDARADLGYFNGSAREKSVDLRLHGLARYDANENVIIDGFVQYDGAEFLRSDLDGEDRDADITNALDPDADITEVETAIPETRQRGLDQASVGASVRFTPRENIEFLNNPAASLRAQTTKSGVLVGGDGATTSSFGASVSTGIADYGVNVSADATVYSTDYDNGAPGESGYQVSARAYKRFKKFTVRGQYTQDKRTNRSLRQRGSVTVSGYTHNVPIPKNANLSLSPTASALWNGDDVSLRGGVFANFHSGDLLGEKTKLDASLGVLQSYAPGTNNEMDKFLTVTLGRRVRLGKNMAVGLSYRNNLEGEQRLGLILDGRFDFNEKRKYAKTKDGRGVLKGRVFHDKNRDGVQQEGELPFPRALVRVKGSRLALRTDNLGYFTIQNIKEGIYEVRVDGRSLPLGFAVADDAQLKVSIQDGFITDLQMPVVQRGQIRGFAYSDANLNGIYDSGEDRIEGAKILLKSKGSDEIIEHAYSTSFGQYAFDDLPAGAYDVVVNPSEKMGIEAALPVSIELDPETDLMVKINVPLHKNIEVKLVENDPARAPPQSNTMVPDTNGPAPP